MIYHKNYVHSYSALNHSKYFRSIQSRDVSLKPTSPNEVTLAVLPLFHAFGIEMYLTHALTSGFTVITMSRYNRHQLVRLVHDYKVGPV